MTIKAISRAILAEARRLSITEGLRWGYSLFPR